MAVTEDDFIARFPEFEEAGVTISVVLDEAVRRTDGDIFGNKTDDAVMYRAAHLLAISPFGQNARMVAKDGTTIYGNELEKLILEHAGGAWGT